MTLAAERLTFGYPGRVIGRVFDPNQCPKTQTCLQETATCGFFVTGTCEDTPAVAASIPDGP